MDQTLKYGSCVKRGTAGTRTDWAKESKKTEEAQNNRTSRKMNFMVKEASKQKSPDHARLSDKLE
jgi:hypothetical protein